MDCEYELNDVAADNGSERHGKVGWAILWLLGVPLPVLLVIYFLTGGGCNGG